MAAKREAPLFTDQRATKRQKPLEGPKVPGLVFVPNFITRDEEEALLGHIEDGEWFDVVLRKGRKEPSRRVQHFGYKYLYVQRTVEPTAPMTDWANETATKIQEHLSVDTPFNQLIVNEYLPGQGITPHTDARCFGPNIASLSLGSHCVMRFTNQKDASETVDVYLPPRSLVVLTGDARTKWKHEIPCRRKDPHPLKPGCLLPRRTRVSLTFRTVP